MKTSLREHDVTLLGAGIESYLEACDSGSVLPYATRLQLQSWIPIRGRAALHVKYVILQTRFRAAEHSAFF